MPPLTALVNVAMFRDRSDGIISKEKVNGEDTRRSLAGGEKNKSIVQRKERWQHSRKAVWAERWPTRLRQLVVCRQQQRRLSGGWGYLVCGGSVFHQIWEWDHLSHGQGGLQRWRRSGRYWGQSGKTDGSRDLHYARHQERHCFKWMTACKKNVLLEGE